MTDLFMTVSTEEAGDARRLGMARRAIAVGNGRDPERSSEMPTPAPACERELSVAEDRVVSSAPSPGSYGTRGMAS